MGRVETSILDVSHVDTRHHRIGLGHHAQKADGQKPHPEPEQERDPCLRNDYQGKTYEPCREQQLTFRAQQQVRSIQSPMNRNSPQFVHYRTTAELLLKRVLRTLFEPTRSAITRTSIAPRRANSLISPPQISIPPQTTIPMIDTAIATGPLSELCRV
jgi:hypothetical protein